MVRKELKGFLVWSLVLSKLNTWSSNTYRENEKEHVFSL
jgi:hypothetical protein